MRARIATALRVATAAATLSGCGAATGLPIGLGPDGGDAEGQHVVGRSDGNNAPPFADSARPGTDGSDGTSHDAGPDSEAMDDARADADVAQPDATVDTSPPLNPDERVAGMGYAIVGVTDHGLIVYGDTTGTCWALPFAGGTARVISPDVGGGGPGSGPCAGGLHGSTTLSHDVVFMSVGSALYTWASPMSAPVLLASTSDGGGAPGDAVASADSSYVAYETPSMMTGYPQWTVANVDGSSPLYLGLGNFAFDESFAVYDGTYPPSPLVALDGANSWSHTMISPLSTSFAVDAVGDVLFTSNVGLTFASLRGNAPVVVADSGADGESVYLAPDGTFAMYGTGFTDPVTAVELPAGTLYEVQAAPNIDVNLLQTLRTNTPGGPVAVFWTEPLGTATSILTVVGVGPGALLPNAALTNYRAATDYEDGDGFTADGASLLIIGTTPGGAFEFGSLALPNGTAPVLLTTNGYDGRPLTGSRVIFHDSYLRNGELQYQGTADLRVADIAAGTSSTLVVSNVDAYFGLSPDRTAVAYTINRGTSADGLYVTTLPTSP